MNIETVDLISFTKNLFSRTSIVKMSLISVNYSQFLSQIKLSELDFILFYNYFFTNTNITLITKLNKFIKM